MNDNRCSAIQRRSEAMGGQNGGVDEIVFQEEPENIAYLPSGRYRCRVAGVEKVIDNFGKDKLKILFQITDGNFAGHSFISWFAVNPKDSFDYREHFLLKELSQAIFGAKKSLVPQNLVFQQVIVEGVSSPDKKGNVWFKPTKFLRS